MGSTHNAAATAAGVVAAPTMRRQSTDASGSKLRYTHRDRNTVLTQRGCNPFYRLVDNLIARDEFKDNCLKSGGTINTKADEGTSQRRVETRRTLKSVEFLNVENSMTDEARTALSTIKNL
jgi:hypothetical protein